MCNIIPIILCLFHTQLPFQVLVFPEVQILLTNKIKNAQIAVAAYVEIDAILFLSSVKFLCFCDIIYLKGMIICENQEKQKKLTLLLI